MNKETDSIKENKNTQKTENVVNSNELKRNENKIDNRSSNSSHHSYKNKNCCDCCDSRCFAISFLIVTGLLSLAIVPNIILVIGLNVSTNKNKDCKAEIYQKNGIIYVLVCILVALAAMGQCCPSGGNNDEDENENRKQVGNGCICSFIRLIIKISSFGISLSLLIITQIYYNDTTTWESCGSVKGWIIYLLVICYIEVIFNSLGFILVIITLFLLCFCGN